MVAVWRRVEGMTRLSGMRVAAVLAHPDDEAFGPAGTLAMCSDMGARIRLFMATRGEKGRRRGSPPFCLPGELGQVRWSELEESCRILGCEPPVHLGLGDKSVDSYGEKDRSKLAGLLDDLDPHILITLGPDGGLAPHPDHIAVSRLARESWELLGRRPRMCYYQRWPEPKTVIRIHGTPPGQLAVDVREYRHLKLKALKAHLTQTQQIHFLWGNNTRVEASLSDTEHFLVPEAGLAGAQARGDASLLFPYVCLPTPRAAG